MPDPTRDAGVSPEIESALREYKAALVMGEEHDVVRAAINQALTAAEARGREQERARLAAITGGGVREMVEAWGQAVFATAIATERRNFDLAIPDKADAAKATLLAAFAAQRERVVGECAPTPSESDAKLKWLVSTEWLARIERTIDANPDAHGSPSWEGIHDVLVALRALLAAPTKGEGVVG